MKSTIQISVLVALSVGSSFAFAEFLGVEVRANVSNATVFVDGVKAGLAPLKVSCTDKPQVIRIESPDREPFTRALAPINGFKETESNWDVQLKYNASIAHTKNLTVTQLSVNSADQEQLRAELCELRKLVEELRLAQMAKDGKQEFAEMPKIETQFVSAEFSHAVEEPTPQMVATQAAAEVVTVTETSVEAPVEAPVVATIEANREISSVVPELSGVFIQLHALLEEKFNRGEALEELVSLKSLMAKSFMNLCKTTADSAGREWSKVFLGPFKNARVARKVSQKIGRGTFVVRNPACVSEPQQTSPVGE